jgi:hypothetical protein
MADEHWEDWFQSPQTGTLAHPDSPAGGSGTGAARPPIPLRYSWTDATLPHPDSPAARQITWQVELRRLAIQNRARAVYEALTSAPKYVPRALYDATGQELHEIVAGIIPGLLMLLGVLAATTALGAAAGAAIGALAFGAGAAPGAAIGAEVGFDIGVALLEYLGLAFLVAYIGKSLLRAASVAGGAIQMAWRSADNPSTQRTVIDRAAHRLAFAVGLVFRGVLQGIVAFLLAKGTAAAASRVPELIGKLRSSKLGAAFAEWVEKNWTRLLNEPKLKTEETGAGAGAGESAAVTALKTEGATRRTQSYKDIDAYEQTYSAKETQARQAGENRVAGGYKAKVTEAVGERSATEYMEKNHPDFVMDQGFKPGSGFDQVYTKYDAAGNPQEMMIVEAKGPGAELSTDAAKGPQMSQQWVENTVSDMVKSDDPATKALGQKLQTALDDGEPPVTGKVIQATGSGGATEVPLPSDPVYNGGRYN